MGKTQAEFIKLVSTGKVLADANFMLPFAKHMRMMARENNALAKAKEKLIAKEMRLVSVYKEAVDEIFQGDKDGKSGLASRIGDVYEILTKIIKEGTPRLKDIVGVIGEVVSATFAAINAMGEFVKALAGGGTEGGTGLLGKAWESVLLFFDLLAFSIWHAIAGIHILADLMKSANDKFGNSWMLSNPSAALAKLIVAPFMADNKSAANSVTVQGDVVIKHDGSQTVTDNVLTQLGM